MSGLEKFQQTDSWRMDFKKLLFTQRTPVMVEPLKNTDRFSLDIAEDLEVLIEQKKSCSYKDMEKKEIEICNANVHGNKLNAQYKLRDYNDSLISKVVEACHTRSVDDSFETLEEICNNTASDPNSTLFRYLHSDNKDDILDAKRNELNRFETLQELDKEQDSFSGLFQHIQIDEEGELTQLEDIEAPSQLWENTITNEKNLQASPVKMIGLLRPSTIIEENIEEDNNTNESSHTTYFTALKSSESELSTSFESATGKKFLNCSYDISEPNELQTEKAVVCDSEICNDVANSNSIIEVRSEDESNYELIKQNISPNESSKMDSRFLKDTMENNLICETSLKFNDTIEEVEFLLKQRIEYMKATTPVNDNKNYKPPKTKFANNDFLEANPIPTQLHIINSDQPFGNKMVKKEIPVGLEIKPFPKLNLFKQPASSGIPKLRSREGMNKQFAHIVSPIGAYMKNTPVTPLMSTMKTQNPKNDILNSTAFRELESESRLCQLRHALSASVKIGSGLAGIPSGAKSLPKKAYISSNLKQVTDERTPLMIPGGKKIQKYLEPAMLPAVVRHDGKMKTTENMQGPNKLQNTKNQCNNSSLADLSLASGDVSLYTIIDARKF